MKVSEYVSERILSPRQEHKATNGYQNCAVIRANAQRDLPHYFRKGQLRRIFFLFPDPHFKACNHRRRIISAQLLDEYAYLLRKGGMVYTITDVEELGRWMKDHLDAHPLFARVEDEELEAIDDKVIRRPFVPMPVVPLSVPCIPGPPCTFASSCT